MINLFLKRLYFKPTYTIGELYVGDKLLCSTLEDTVRDKNKDGDLDDLGEYKIYGETAIPYGRYEVRVTYSPKLKRDLPLVLDVKHFVGIRIHRGATNANTLGCILVGENTQKGRLTNGAYHENKIVNMLKAYTQAGETIYLNII